MTEHLFFNTLPNLVIIGAMKCGTTSLHYYLNLHPEISMSRRKELDFFTEKKFNKGIEWYKSNFQKPTRILGETSPNYTNSTKFPGVPERMHATIPDAKLIYIVRDPIKRMIAQYAHQYSYGLENRPIDEALTEKNWNMYLDRSLYYKQISYFLKYFDRSQLLILSAEELRENTTSSLVKIFSFLGVDPRFKSKSFYRQKHKTAQKRRKTPIGETLSKSALLKGLKWIPKYHRRRIESVIYYPFSKPIGEFIITQETRDFLKEFLSEDINKFRQLAEKQFLFWDV